MPTFVDIHVLQSVPPSNINRDDTGSPKSAVYGGVRRARVSSQAWKRATRIEFNKHLDPSETGIRSKRLVERIASHISSIDSSLTEKANDLAAGVLQATGIKTTKPTRGKSDEKSEESAEESTYLLFLSNLQVRNLAELAVESETSGEQPDKKKAKAIANANHSFDIALFGRMVADTTDLNVDAAAQVAHAISVHGVSNEFDYYTAVDDNGTDEHAGAGMIGTIEYNSSTLYRYATVNVDQLRNNLGDDAATAKALGVFLDSFVRSMPTGKQNTFANRTLPQAIVVTVRDDQPLNLVGAFETAIPATGGDGTSSRLRLTSNALAQHVNYQVNAYSTSAAPTWITTAHPDAQPLESLGTVANNLAHLVDSVVTAAVDSAKVS